MNLKDKVVVITGSSQGLGKALAEVFLREGSRVVVSARDGKSLSETVQELGVVAIPADVTQEGQLTELLEKTVAQFGAVDIWINNAGVWLPHDYIENMDMERTKKMFDVNVFGLMNGCRVALRYMKNKKAGMIVNICSTSAIGPRPKASGYSASKYAVNGISQAIREESKEFGVSVVTVFPGGIKTHLFDEVQPDEIASFMEPLAVASKIVLHIKQDAPDPELVIKRPTT